MSADGPVPLATGLANGASYTVAIRMQPASPPHTCAVANATGTVAASNVSNVTVACALLPPLSLISSVPADAALDVDLSGALVVTFSAPLATTPAPRTTATLRADVSGEVVELPTGSVSGAGLTLHPAAPMALQTSYTLTFSTDLRGTSGELPAAPLSIRFTTRDGQWQEPVLLESLAGDIYELDLAMNGRGDASLVFIRELIGDFTPNAIRYTEASGWGDVFELSPSLSLSSNNGVTVSMDDAGNSFAAWVQESLQSTGDVMTRRFSAAGDSWEPAVELDTSTAVASAVDMDVDSAGNACIAWSQGNAIWASRYDVALTDWQQPFELVPTHNSPYVNAAAGCTVAWGDGSDAWVTQEENAGQWSTPLNLSSQSTAETYIAGLTGNASGTVAAALYVVDSAQFTLWVTGFSGLPGADWTNPRQLESSNAGDTHYLAPAMDASGNILFAWMEWGASGFGYQLWSARYTTGQGWGAVELLADSEEGVVEFGPAVAIDAAGNGFVTWTQRDTANIQQVWARRHVPGAGWGEATLLDRATTHARNPKVAVDDLGRAWAVWEQNNATGNADAFAARFE